MTGRIEDGLRDVQGRSVADWLRIAAEKCCQCTNGHHDQIEYPYGTEGDVRISRDLARTLADFLDAHPAPPAAPEDALERARGIASNEAWAQFARIPSSNAGDYANRVVTALAARGLIGSPAAPEATEVEDVRFNEAAAQMRDPERYEALRALTFDQRHPCPIEDCRLSAEEHHRLAFGYLSELADLRRQVHAPWVEVETTTEGGSDE